MPRFKALLSVNYFLYPFSLPGWIMTLVGWEVQYVAATAHLVTRQPPLRCNWGENISIFEGSLKKWAADLKLGIRQARPKGIIHLN